MVFLLASIGLPGTGGFIGEILVLLGVFKVNIWVATFLATGVILGAAYMLYLYKRLIFGALTKKTLLKIIDLSPREIAVFSPLLIVTIWMGIYPNSLLNFMHVSVANLLQKVQTSLAKSSVIYLAGG